MMGGIFEDEALFVYVHRVQVEGGKMIKNKKEGQNEIVVLSSSREKATVSLYVV